MKQMLESGKVKLRGGCCIDLYNQNFQEDVFVSITTKVDSCNHYWVTELKDEEDYSD